MSEAHSGSLLVEYFKEFLRKRDLDEFRNRVTARYNEGTLGRILAGSPDVSARRAAVLSLGILGAASSRATPCWEGPCATTTSRCGAWPKMRSGPSGFAPTRPSTTTCSNRCGTRSTASSSTRPRRLVDPADCRRARTSPRLITSGRSFISSRGDSPRAPTTASSVLARNPYHIGAIEGLAKCQLGLNRPRDALKSLRRALKLRPHNTALRASIRELETQIESDEDGQATSEMIEAPRFV